MRSAFGIVPVIAAVASALTPVIGTGVSIAEQIQTGRQQRELAAESLAQSARLQAWQVQQANVAQSQAAALAVQQQRTWGRLIPLGILGLVAFGLLVSLGRRKRSAVPSR